MDKPAIQLTNVEKEFFFQHQRTLKELVQAIFSKQKTLEKIHALKNVSFSVKPGEAVGIIGRNGAGKSTLLKLIAGVSDSSKGKVTVNGRVAPLIELGAGFHPELSGRENVYLNGVILGLTEKEIDRKFDEIVEFAGVKKFIDTPIKHYSSGMYMRLAFAVAVFTNPEILLIDELLAVGDSQFQKKCLAKMEDFKRQGVTTIFVSHDPKLIESFCDRVIYLEAGEVIYDGEVKEGLRVYLDQD